jgi:hypothetical protein
VTIVAPQPARLAALLLAALAFAPASAGIDLNEVGAFLVYPGVEANGGAGIETFLTITNTSSQSVIAHVAFINGDSSSSRYCYECNFDVPLSGLDTETLVLVNSNGVTHIRNLDTGSIRSCWQSLGFVTVDVEDATHRTLTDNILLGEAVVVDYANGSAMTVEALSIQGDLGNGDRNFAFDGAEYRKFPAVLGADFVAPDFGGPLNAHLTLFTLAFKRQFPPLTDCSIIGFDARENQFSNSFQFGCWTQVSLEDVDPEFAYPYLGGTTTDEHGWLQLSCTVYGTGVNGVVDGGVHGAISQFAATGTVLRRLAAGAPSLASAAGWGRLLYQSGTVGDSLTFQLEAPATGGTF